MPQLCTFSVTGVWRAWGVALLPLPPPSCLRRAARDGSPSAAAGRVWPAGALLRALQNAREEAGPPALGLQQEGQTRPLDDSSAAV